MPFEHRRVDDALRDGRGHAAAGKIGPRKLGDRRDYDRLLDRDRSGANRRSHGIRNVIGANPPRHIVI
jgi:hypothetical protein